MPSEALVVRFPTGRNEYALTENVPKVGDSVEREGREWRVVEVEATVDGPTVVTLRLAEEAPGYS
jgi:hypothetical protein